MFWMIENIRNKNMRDEENVMEMELLRQRQSIQHQDYLTWVSQT